MKVMFCSECGAVLDEKGKCSNPSCVSHAAKSTSSGRYAHTSEPTWKPANSAEKGKRIVPDCIKPDLEEVPIKQYDIARLQTLIKGAFAEGRLQVTNKRLLFRSTGSSIVGPTSLQYEFSVEEIAGIEIRKEARLNFFTMILLLLFSTLICSIIQPIFSFVYNNAFIGTIFTILVVLASIFLFFFFKKKTFIRYAAETVLFAALPINFSSVIKTAMGGGNDIQRAACTVTILVFIISLLYIVFAPNLVIRIVTKGGSPSVEIRRKDGLFSFQHNEYTGFSQVLPGPDVDMAMKELGALIREIQQTGGYSETV